MALISAAGLREWLSSGDYGCFYLSCKIICHVWSFIMPSVTIKDHTFCVNGVRGLGCCVASYYGLAEYPNIMKL